MKTQTAYLELFRDRAIVQGLARRIEALTIDLKKSLTFMEVCGTHTMAVGQFGIRSILPPQVKLISGPGCPVCVTPNICLDRAIAISRVPGVIVAGFGDMMRVRGSSSSLLEERAKGADIRVVYSPLDAVALAAKNPENQVVFLGVGFETTAPAIAGSILVAAQKKLSNFYVLDALKTMPAPMAVLASDRELSIDGFICPAHVSAVIGAAAYGFLAERHQMPCVITGFEPADIMHGVELLVRQKLAGEAKVEIQYSRVVSWEGNAKARQVLAQVFGACDAEWRGIGMIPASGLSIKKEYARFDATKMFPVSVESLRDHPGCSCGEILKGKLQPRDCGLFGTVCTPEAPVGACMVSSEGSCAAAYKFGA